MRAVARRSPDDLLRILGPAQGLQGTVKDAGRVLLSRVWDLATESLSLSPIFAEGYVRGAVQATAWGPTAPFSSGGSPSWAAGATEMGTHARLKAAVDCRSLL